MRVAAAAAVLVAMLAAALAGAEAAPQNEQGAAPLGAAATAEAAAARAEAGAAEAAAEAAARAAQGALPPGVAAATSAPISAPMGAPMGDTTWETQEEWRRKGALQLERSLARIRQQEELARSGVSGAKAGVARNVVLFIGDGMGVATTTAAGMMVGGEGHLLAWERFPYVGLAKTYSTDHLVADSASTATALLTASKTNSRMLGLDARASKTTCDREVNRVAAMASLAQWAQRAGKAAGVVTTARVTHATPAAAYARINHRDWECDSKLPAEAVGCVRDIARQLVEEEPGRGLRVVLGGGRRQLGASGLDDPDEDDSCVRSDGRNLTQFWTALPGRREYVTTRTQLLEPGLVERSDFLMGLFAAGHMAYDAERAAAQDDQPSLRDMTRVALRALRRHGGRRGFFLLVEGARIDMAHHKNYARLALLEAAQLDDAVHAALDEVDLEDTLVVVTGDHSHAMTINGYPTRGSDVLGISYPESKGEDPSAPKYETLTYATGPGAKDHEGRRIQDIPEEERRRLRYRHQTGQFTGEDETHAGEDVPVYATGAGSELLTGVYEQSYVGTVMAFAAGMGPFERQGDLSARASVAVGAAADRVAAAQAQAPANAAGRPASAPAAAALALAAALLLPLLLGGLLR